MSEVDSKASSNGANGFEQQVANGEAVQTSPEYLSGVRELSLRSFREEAEIHAISIALRQTGWNRKRAAKLLSVSYRGLLYKMRRHNITPDNGIRVVSGTQGTK